MSYTEKPITEETLDDVFKDLYSRIDKVERTLDGLQILLGKAAEYKARPKKERLPR